MSTIVTPEQRSTFAGIADYLIPNAEGMPSASEVDVHGAILDRVLTLRADLQEAFLRGLNGCAGAIPAEAANALNRDDPVAMGAVGLVASAAYYMTPRVRDLIGYPGQESRPDLDPDAPPPYVTNGMLQRVIDRGSIFKPTPR
jgi:hypothetical protein